MGSDSDADKKKGERPSTPTRRQLTKTGGRRRQSNDGLEQTYFEPDQLEHSEFYGFVNLLILLTCVTVGVFALVNYLEKGYVVNMSTVLTPFVDMEHTFLVFVAMNLLSFYVVVLEKTAHVLPWYVLFALHHVTLGVLYAGTVWQLLGRATPWMPAASILAEMVVLSMKCHSYFMINREYQDKGSERDTSVSHYFLFLCSPVLVYQLRWPRTKRVRPWYVLEKLIACVGVILFMMIIIDEFLMPVYERLHIDNPLLSFAKLAVPLVVLYLAIFFVIFEVILNGIAELTRFGNRDFYGEWWNSTSFDQFSRLWNKPVHRWLLRHVYRHSLDRHGASRGWALVITFFFSALLHEMILAVAFRFVRPYLLFLMMFQFVLIYIGSFPIFNGTRLGNFGFWCGFLTGLPMLYFAYAREFQMQVHGVQ